MSRSRPRNPLRAKYQHLKALGNAAPSFSLAIDIGASDKDDLYLGLPFRRNWILILIGGVFTATFAFPLVGVFGSVTASQDGGLFSLISVMFSLFWGLGWSVAVASLGTIFLLLLCGRETLRVRGDQLILRIGIPSLGFGASFPSAYIRHFRARSANEASGNDWRGDHLAFDFADGSIGFGSAIDPDRAQQIVEQLQSLFPDHGKPMPEINADSAVAIQEGIPPAVKSSPQAVPEIQARPHSLTSLSSLALIVSNLIPLVGVLVAGWDIGEIMLLFWAESAVIGFYNLCKMAKIGSWTVLFYGPFFVGHYGAFMAGHLLFIYGFFGDNFAQSSDVQATQVFQDFVSLAPVLLAFFISHGISFFTNFLGRKEYLGKQVSNQMGQPYKRIIAMHVTIIFGGFMALALETTLPALLLLIFLKLTMDMRAHLSEHR